MSAPYTPQPRVRSPITFPTDGDEVDEANFVAPMRQVADLAAVSQGTWAKNYFSTLVKPASTPGIFAIAAGLQHNSRGYVAVGPDFDASDGFIACSYDGATWTEQASGPDVPLNGVAYSTPLGLWAVVGAANAGDAYVATSPTGRAAYTERGNPANGNLNSVCVGPAGEFVAVGDVVGVQSYILRSTDGVTWGQQVSPVNAALYGVAYANGLFVAVGPFILTSVNGTTWLIRAYPACVGIPAAVAWNGRYWFVLTTSGEVLRSPTGTTWTKLRNSGVDSGAVPRGIAADPVTGVLVATGNAATGALVSLDDGVTWDPAAVVAASGTGLITPRSICFGHGRFLIGGDGVVARGLIR